MKYDNKTTHTHTYTKIKTNVCTLLECRIRHQAIVFQTFRDRVVVSKRQERIIRVTLRHIPKERDINYAVVIGKNLA
jgi:hypothetical protein